MDDSLNTAGLVELFQKVQINRVANWDIVPNEIRLIIVGYMNNSTKREFQLCSKDCQELIEEDKKTSLKEVVIGNYRVLLRHLSHTFFDFESFDETQTFISKIFKYKAYVSTFKLNIDVGRMTKAFKFPEGQLDVESLKFKAEGYVQNKSFALNLRMDMLKQINPLELKKVEIVFEQFALCECQEVYDLPQIYSPKILRINNFSTIRDDQLLKLNAIDLEIEGAECLTKPGVAAFLKKCLNELNTKNFHIKIKFNAPRDEVLLDGFSISEERLPKRSKYQRWPNGKVRLVCEDEPSWIVNSPYPEYVLHVYERRRNEDDIRVEAIRHCINEDFDPCQ